MKTLAVDIDDTLYPFNNLAREVFIDVALEQADKRMQRGAYCAWGEWRSPIDVTDQETWLKIIDICHSDENILAQEPYPYADRVLDELAEQYNLLYISNRREDAYEATESWLLKNGFPEGRLHCTTGDKRRLLGQCQYLIDDRPKTLVEFVYDFHWKHRHGSENEPMVRKAFGLYAPYNAALTDVPGIKLAPNWKLLRQYLIDQDVLTPRSKVGATS